MSPQRADDSPDATAAATGQAVAAAVDLAQPVRLGLGILAAGLALFIAWAAFAPLDEGVVAPAQVAIDSGRRVIQHQFGGVVAKVHVKEGQRVKAGDVLIELDAGTLQANVESVLQAYHAQRAAEGRLLAELAGEREIRFHPDLLEASARASSQQHMETQRRLFQSRAQAHAAETAATRSAIEAVRTQAEGLRAALVQRQAQEKALQEQTAYFARLADEGFAPRTQLLQQQQALAEVRS
ncbi:biotin/lipoyl-binding protein, partial [Ramlibacter sp.]|uniref:biotin/lipoyl-binding protein n=1 Tax=Ramlibacter sp. TaxID=1917967 RepID=UPI0035B39C7F